MVLVLLGTQNNSFIRLLEEVEKCINLGIIQDVVKVQLGYTEYVSDKMELLKFVSNDELEKMQKEADLIITHGGVGSITSSIKLGKKVIAVPRLEKYKEHLNDHQLQIVNSFNESGYIIGISDVSELADVIKKSSEFIPEKFQSNTEKMIKIIEDYIN